MWDINLMKSKNILILVFSRWVENDMIQVVLNQTLGIKLIPGPCKRNQ